MNLSDMEKFSWLKVYISPFKPPKIKWYIGKTAIGIPYFLPRKWVKSKTKPGYLESKPLRVGFSSCGLGWKTKWSDTDFRHEWDPVMSFVFFGLQIACWVEPEHSSHYWEAWLCYELKTDKTKSVKERLVQCKELFPSTWVVHEDDEPEKTVCYYDLILKTKHL